MSVHTVQNQNGNPQVLFRSASAEARIKVPNGTLVRKIREVGDGKQWEVCILEQAGRYLVNFCHLQETQDPEFPKVEVVPSKEEEELSKEIQHLKSLADGCRTKLLAKAEYSLKQLSVIRQQLEVATSHVTFNTSQILDKISSIETSLIGAKDDLQTIFISPVSLDLVQGVLMRSRVALGSVLEDVADIAAQALSHVPASRQQEGSEAQELHEEWFEAVEKIVLIKEAPSKDSKSVGLIRQGYKIQVKGERVRGDDGHAWVALTAKTLEYMCETPTPHGFVLMDATHLGIGLLLKGPLQPGFDESAEDWHHIQKLKVFEDSQQQQLAWPRFQKERAPIRRLEASNKKGQFLSDLKARQTKKCLERIKNEAQQYQDHCTRMRQAGLMYRAQLDHVHVKQCNVNIVKPEMALTRCCSCQPGVALFTNGIEWCDPTGGLWLQQLAEGPSFDKIIGWMLVRNHSDDVDGPFMLQEGVRMGFPVLIGEAAWMHIPVTVKYLNDFTILDIFLDPSTTVKSVKKAVSICTGLSLKSIMLLKAPIETVPGTSLNSRNLLQDGCKLETIGFSGKVEICLVYLDNFVEDFVGLYQSPYIVPAS